MKEAIEVNPEILADRQSHVNNILHPASGSAAGQNPSDALFSERNRKPRSDAGKPRAAKAKETAPLVHPGGGVMTPSQRARAGELLQILEDAHQAVYFTTEKYNKAHANFHAYLDELTEKQ